MLRVRDPWRPSFWPPPPGSPATRRAFRPDHAPIVAIPLSCRHLSRDCRKWTRKPARPALRVDVRRHEPREQQKREQGSPAAADDLVPILDVPSAGFEPATPASGGPLNALTMASTSDYSITPVRRGLRNHTRSLGFMSRTMSRKLDWTSSQGITQAGEAQRGRLRQSG